MNDETTSTGPATVDRVAVKPVLAVAAVVAAIHLLVATRYGWHRDEFYYVTAGRHLAWGYVDQPPLTPFLARAAASLSTDVLPLRLLVVGFQAATLIMAALIARELGGRRFAQTLTAGCIGGAAIFVGASLFLGTTPTDQFFWTVIIWSTVRAVRTASRSAWVIVGIVSGLGLENKHTVAMLLVGLAVGLAVLRRDLLRSAGPWIAAAVALGLWAPNLIWDAQHHWVTLDMAKVLAEKQGGVGGAVSQLPLLFLIFPGPLIAFLWFRGARFARRQGEGREHAWLLGAGAFVVLALTAAGGKPYYAAPMLAPLFALGAVATERSGPAGAPRRRRAGWIVAGSGLIAPLLALPFFSPAVSTDLRGLAKEPMETYGWAAFTEQMSKAVAQHSGASAAYVSNYGEAGALATFGPRYRLTVPIVAGQNAYRDWGPPPGTPTDVICAGQFTKSFLEESWTDVEFIAKFKLPRGLVNEEIDNDASLFHCRGPKGTWAQLWPNLSYLS